MTSTTPGVLSDETLATALRGLMARRRVTTRDVADGTGIPLARLRALLSTSPLELYISEFAVICEHLGIKASEVLFEATAPATVGGAR